MDEGREGRGVSKTDNRWGFGWERRFLVAFDFDSGISLGGGGGYMGRGEYVGCPTFLWADGSYSL